MRQIVLGAGAASAPTDAAQLGVSRCRGDWGPGGGCRPSRHRRALFGHRLAEPCSRSSTQLRVAGHRLVAADVLGAGAVRPMGSSPAGQSGGRRGWWGRDRGVRGPGRAAPGSGPVPARPRGPRSRRRSTRSRPATGLDEVRPERGLTGRPGSSIRATTRTRARRPPAPVSGSLSRRTTPSRSCIGPSVRDVALDRAAGKRSPERAARPSTGRPRPASPGSPPTRCRTRMLQHPPDSPCGTCSRTRRRRPPSRAGVRGRPRASAA